MSCLHLKHHKARKLFSDFSPFVKSNTNTNLQNSSVNLKEKSRCLQAATTQSIPSLSERVKQLTQENELLRKEIVFYQKIWNTVISVQEETEGVVTELKQILTSFNKVQTEAEAECLNF